MPDSVGHDLLREWQEAMQSVLIDLIETTEPAEVDADRWSELLRSGADEVAFPPGRRAAGVRRRPAKPTAARRSTR
jgi:hypothetical protein